MCREYQNGDDNGDADDDDDADDDYDDKDDDDDNDDDDDKDDDDDDDRANVLKTKFRGGFNRLNQIFSVGTLIISMIINVDDRDFVDDACDDFEYNVADVFG